MKKIFLTIISIVLIMAGVLIILFGREWNIVRAAEGSVVANCGLFIMWFCALAIFASDYFRKS